MNDTLDRLTVSLQESAKYRNVSEDLIRRIGQRELTRRRNLKEAIKETKNTLHQIAGAYLENTPPYTKWREAIALAEQSSEEWKVVLRGMMQYHASTRERLPSLETFYTTTLADIQPVRTVLDLACGLNPLAIPWMPLADDFTYYAYDLYKDMMAFLNSYLAIAAPYSAAGACDITASPPQQSVHVAYILKFLPLLEQLAKEETLPWLQKIQAEYLLVSFPTRTLGGRDIRMAENYEVRFRERIQETGWEMQRFAFPNELCFLIKTTLVGG